MATDVLLDIKVAAGRLGVAVTTLYDWRYKGVGPASARIGGRVMYRERDLQAYIDRQFESAS